MEVYCMEIYHGHNLWAFERKHERQQQRAFRFYFPALHKKKKRTNMNAIGIFFVVVHNDACNVA